MNAAPVMAVVFGLVKVMVIRIPVLSGVVAAAKDLVIVGGLSTVRVAVLLAALEPASLVTAAAGIVFEYAPANAERTLTVTSQKEFAGTVAPDSSACGTPPSAVTVPPPQVVAPAGDGELTRLAG